MRRNSRSISFGWLLLVACSRGNSNGVPSGLVPEPGPVVRAVDFESVAVGGLPEEFVVAATRPTATLATWRVEDDASSAGRVLKMVQPNHSESQSFNLCWSPTLKFADGSLEVKVRADEGEEDQGGGLIWRAQSAEDYYIARFNPLESNLRVYVVVKGERKQLGSAEVEGATGNWFTLRIDHRGEHIVVSMDGVARLDVRDASIGASGGVGFWTKADAMSTFDDFVVRAATP